MKVKISSLCIVRKMTHTNEPLGNKKIRHWMNSLTIMKLMVWFENMTHTGRTWMRQCQINKFYINPLRSLYALVFSTSPKFFEFFFNSFSILFQFCFWILHNVFKMPFLHVHSLFHILVTQNLLQLPFSASFRLLFSAFFLLRYQNSLNI